VTRGGELYRDPVYDGATDPIMVIADGVWTCARITRESDFQIVLRIDSCRSTVWASAFPFAPGIA